MSILNIIAAFECDGCGAHFKADMDRSNDIPKGWGLDEVAENALHGGEGGISHQNGFDLCKTCTEVVDAEPGDEPPRPERIRELIDAALRGRARHE